MSANGCFAVHLASRPKGRAEEENFTFVEEYIPEPTPGTALVENVYLSVDPYMREMMDQAWGLRSPLEGRSIGRVIESRDPQLHVGQLVFHRKGWRTHAIVSGNEVRVLAPAEGVPLSAYLGILGGTGLTAYVALTRIAQLQAGDAVFISAAAGGVGSAAGQIARLLGAGKIIGSAGSADKVKYLIEHLGFDAAFDYREGSIPTLLAEAAPEGIDAYIDNVGGAHLEAAIGALREHGRIAWVGAVAQYDNLSPSVAPRNLFEIVGKSLRMEGFLVKNYRHLQDELENLLIPSIQAGCITVDQTVMQGFDRTVQAFIGMLRGGNIGKMIVQLK